MFRRCGRTSEHAVWETMTGALEAAMASDMVCMFAWERSRSMRRAFILSTSSRPKAVRPPAASHPTPAWFWSLYVNWQLRSPSR